ncbi:hypothetical protein [Caulobacter sp. RL271]|jgi:hypothetical protein|uniref:DUF1963 domain-containing protein n=1 Tax=Caulobacter segnis TaxID=88688 RepID=A0ABY4ZV45_9CAUL|nr:hypothetical protein [Caulobacter segnis]USQ96573.1 hypothetical protein MZV50_02970 [Caulobacter segnis]
MIPAEQIIEYLEGRVALPDFYTQILHDESLQAFLELDASIPPYTNVGNLFLYLMDQDVSKPATDINVRDALSKLLTALGVEHKSDTSSLKTYELVLDASPAWLSPPEAYVKALIAGFETLGGRREKLAFAKDKIARDFRYLKKPPKWLQSPSWLFDGDTPLLFVGQLDASGLAHDVAQIYVFFDERNGGVQTLMQVA